MAVAPSAANPQTISRIDPASVIARLLLMKAELCYHMENKPIGETAHRKFCRTDSCQMELIMKRAFGGAVLSLGLLAVTATAQDMMRGVDLSSSDMVSAEMTRAQGEGALAMATAAAPADFTGKRLSSLDLSGLDLSGAIFRAARLNKTKLAGANLDRAVLDQAWLLEADLTGANVRGADLLDR